VLRLRPKQNADFWWYATNNASWWEREGSAQPFVRVSPSLRHVLSVPPLNEQLLIAEWLVDRLKKEDAAIERAEREIDLLLEYRTRLVADVVTGKLDVRPAARHLPTETVEPEVAPDPEELTEPEEAVV
jgi:type I restriction enzyme S subunit